MRAALLLVIVALAGCDSVTDSEYTGRVRYQHENDPCQHFGSCFTCMPGFNGKMECGLKFSSFCPGTENDYVEYREVREHHKSGKITVDEERKIIKQGACL